MLHLHIFTIFFGEHIKEESIQSLLPSSHQSKVVAQQPITVLDFELTQTTKPSCIFLITFTLHTGFYMADSSIKLEIEHLH